MWEREGAVKNETCLAVDQDGPRKLIHHPIPIALAPYMIEVLEVRRARMELCEAGIDAREAIEIDKRETIPATRLQKFECRTEADLGWCG